MLAGDALVGGGLLIRRPVVEEQHQQQRREERRGDADDVTAQRIERADGQHRGEHEGLRLDVEQAHHDAADEAARQQAQVRLLEAQHHAVQARLGNAAEQAGEHAAGRHLAHGSVLLAHGDDHDAGDQAEAREIPRAHGALDEVVAQRRDVLDHDRVERPVQAQRHHERVDQRHHDGQDERREPVDGQQHVGNAVAQADAERADDEGGQRDHDQQREERHEHHLDGARDDLLQALLHEEQQHRGEQRREDLAGVVVEDHRQAEDGDGVALVAQRDELRGQHRRRDRGTDPLVGAELPRGGGADHDRQEVEHRAPHGVEELPRRWQRLAFGRVEVLDAERVGEHQQRDDQRRAEQRPQHRPERVGEEFEAVVDPAELAADAVVLLLAVGAGFRPGLLALRRLGPAVPVAVPHPGLAHEALVVVAHVAAHDHLQAGVALGDDAEDLVVGVDGVLVGERQVVEVEAQAGGAVRHGGDVLRSADVVQDEFRG